MASVNDIRSSFLNFFEHNDHEIVSSSPLVPRNDPTLMFTNSGMVQFKNLLLGQEIRDYKRATTAQKCVRAGGKHNDLDNVGYTARHHTFFEMLGNFSFGDYFKAEAIPFAWDLITKEFGIDQNKLLVTVYHTDDEAADIWKKYTNLSDDRIIRIASDDNFWRMGATGPCGPCSEIFYDHGDHIWGGPPGSAQEDGDRFIEIWNIVFMQNEQHADGSMTNLDMQSIDTGMGLERIAALLQGGHDNYDTDLMRDLIEASAHATGVDPYGKQNIHHRVIADHLRAVSFLIADGILPSNEGRGYVLRRIMRRAMRHAHMLGAKDPVMHKLVSTLIKQMGGAYPELNDAKTIIEETLLLEETRFKSTLDRGLKLLDNEVSTLNSGALLSGRAAFKLYDTYGFPLDLTQDVLRERGVSVDTDGFNAAMAEQKNKARESWVGSGESADETVWLDMASQHGCTDFLGYDTLEAQSILIAIIKDGVGVDQAHGGDEVMLAFNQTPFYAQSGGQIGDKGVIVIGDAKIDVRDVKSKAGVFIHSGFIVRGDITVGQTAQMLVCSQTRNGICHSHSTTHLLNEALRDVLGNHVVQRGSLNAKDRLRFDFSHTQAMTADQIYRVEQQVNDYIRQNSVVQTRIMTPDNARRLGAQALFGEKYGKEVRVVSMGYKENSAKGLDKHTYSLELCGGTHVEQTGDIGSFIIMSELASAQGVRRIEALTGQAAIDYTAQQAKVLSSVMDVLKCPMEQVAERLKDLMTERKSFQNEISNLRKELAISTGDHTLKPIDINGIPFIAQILNAVPGKDLRPMIDAYKKRFPSGVVVLISDTDGKAAIAAGVTEDLITQISAVDIVKTAALKLGGKGGGGRPDMAQAGGRDMSNVKEALEAVKTLLKG